MGRTAARAALAIALLLTAGRGVAAEDTGRPTIYKWVDENGIAHYTTDRKRIPRNLRNKIRGLDEVKAEQAAAGAAGGGSAAAATAPSRYDLYSVRDADELGSGVAGSGVTRGGFQEGEDPLGDGDLGTVDPSPDPAVVARRNEIDQQIADLEAELAEDELRLKQLISQARQVEGQPAPLYGMPELEELARRFPKLQAQIATLRAERRRLEGTP